MPTGLNGPTPRGSSQTFRRRPSPGMRSLWLRNGEFAVAKFLAVGNDDDPHLGSADVLMENGTYNWIPAPGAVDDPDGRCRLPQAPSYDDAIRNGLIPPTMAFEDYVTKTIEERRSIPPGYTARSQFAVYLWVYSKFKTQQNQATPDGRFPLLPEVEVSDSIRKYVVNANGSDPAGFRRYREDMFAPAYFMNGPGKDGAFRNQIRELKDLMEEAAETPEQRSAGLSAFDVVIYRRQGPNPADQFNASTWTFRRVPNGVAEFAEVMARKDDAMKAEISKAYFGLPSIYRVFDHTIKWPLVESADVPQMAQPVAVSKPSPAPLPTPEPPAAQFSAPVPEPPMPRQSAPVAENETFRRFLSE